LQLDLEFEEGQALAAALGTLPQRELQLVGAGAGTPERRLKF
jgi:hypothetical protein